MEVHVFNMWGEAEEGDHEKLNVVYGNDIDCNSEQLDDAQICVVMVGLPARGKSLIAQKSEFSSPSSPHISAFCSLLLAVQPLDGN